MLTLLADSPAMKNNEKKRPQQKVNAAINRNKYILKIKRIITVSQ